MMSVHTLRAEKYLVHAKILAARLRDDQFADREYLSAKLGWRNDNWNVSVWGRTLTDDTYVSFAATTYPITGMNAYRLAPPRTWGATVRYDF